MVEKKIALRLLSRLNRIYDRRDDFLRRYPWRETSNWFWALIAEILLQRTTARSALRAYEKFVAVYDSPSSVLEDPSYMFQIINEIGIFSRTERIIDICRTLVNDFGSNVPANKAELKQLPGVGEYISSALLVNLRNQPLAMVDSNVVRICCRLSGEELSIREVSLLVEEFVRDSRGDPKTKNLSLLDFSMALCIPGRFPKCLKCFLASECEYAKRNKRTTTCQ